MFRSLLPTLCVILLAGCGTPDTAKDPASRGAAAASAQFAGWPAPQAPFDEMPVTPVETVGASRTE